MDKDVHGNLLRIKSCPMVSSDTKSVSYFSPNSQFSKSAITAYHGMQCTSTARKRHTPKIWSKSVEAFTRYGERTFQKNKQSTGKLSTRNFVLTFRTVNANTIHKRVLSKSLWHASFTLMTWIVLVKSGKIGNAIYFLYIVCLEIEYFSFYLLLIFTPCKPCIWPTICYSKEYIQKNICFRCVEVLTFL